MSVYTAAVELPVIYDELSSVDKQAVREWIDDRFVEFREELEHMRGSNTEEFRCMVDRIEIAGDKIHFHMLSNDDFTSGFEAEISDGYMNDCSSDEIYLSTGTHRIWFTR